MGSIWPNNAFGAGFGFLEGERLLPEASE